MSMLMVAQLLGSAAGLHAQGSAGLYCKIIIVELLL